VQVKKHVIALAEAWRLFDANQAYLVEYFWLLIRASHFSKSPL
jgi:hypothetical protein